MDAASRANSPATGGAPLSFVLRSAVSLAWDSIRGHKLRSFLTLLGVIIGVASVILVGSAIDGLGLTAQDTVSKAFGSESFMIAQIAQVGNTTRKQIFEKLKYNRRLQLADSRYLESAEGDTTLFSPYRQAVTDTKRENLTSEDTSILGAASDLQEIRDIALTEGRFFTQTEERNAAYVAVIGDDLRKNLFPAGGSPMGRTFRIQDLEFTVIGMTERLGSNFGQSQDNSAYIPVTSFNRLFGPGSSTTIFGRPRPSSGLTMQAALDRARVAMRVRFHQKPGEVDRFDVLTPDAIRGFIDQILALVAAIVIPVTLISLVVGGIVIMNIMLVSVTERTREIGIRKSLGARQRDIMLQILIEAVIMAFSGGLIGVLIGAGFITLLAKVLAVTLRVPPVYVALSVIVSGTVGVVSGWYPASKAAKLDPIVALRAD
jgi:putative ABC transport system permease protein